MGMKERWINFLLGPKYRLLLGFFLFLGISVSGVFFIHSDYSIRVWFDKGTPEMNRFDNFERMFGGEEFVSVGLRTKNGKITEKDIQFFRGLADSLWMIPGVIRVESINDHKVVSGAGDEILVSSLDDYAGDAEKFMSKAKSIDTIRNVLISENGTYFMFYATLAPVQDKTRDFESVVELTKRLVKEKIPPEYEAHVLGSVTVADAYRDVAGKDNKRMIPLMISLVAIMIFLLFGGLGSTVVTLGVCVATIGSAFGYMGYLGLVYNNIVAAVPGILMAISIADTVHVLTAFYQGKRDGLSDEEALRFSFSKNFLPTILTTITTAISLCSIAFTNLIPIQTLGLVSCIGCILAWFYSYVSVSLGVRLFPKVFAKSNLKIFDAFMSDKLVGFLSKYSTAIVVFFLIGAGYSTYKAFDNEVNSDPLMYFAPDYPVRASYDRIKGEMRGLRGIEMVIDSGVDGGVKDPNFLGRLKEFTAWLNQRGEVVNASSALEIIEEMNEVVSPEMAGKLPQDRNQIAELLFLYQLGLPQGQGINHLISVDERYLRLRVRWDIERTMAGIDASELYMNKAKDSYDLNASVGGAFPIYTGILGTVVRTLFQSMIVVVIIVFIIMSLVYRNLYIAALSMLPNIIPIIVGLALISWMDLYIDMGTSIVSAICLGIAVDDTIHFVTEYMRYRKERGYDPHDAILHTLAGTGRALTATTAFLVVGFGAFMFADFLPNRHFGMLCALILSMALLTDLVFLPALFFKLDRFKMPGVKDGSQLGEKPVQA